MLDLLAARVPEKKILADHPELQAEDIQAAIEYATAQLNHSVLQGSRSFNVEEFSTSALHAKWIMEALESGPAKPFKAKDLDAAFATGLKRTGA